MDEEIIFNQDWGRIAKLYGNYTNSYLFTVGRGKIDVFRQYTSDKLIENSKLYINYEISPSISCFRVRSHGLSGFFSVIRALVCFHFRRSTFRA